MKLLSIVIVNYNVKHFLDQCLASVFGSLHEGFDLDVWVVDNNSIDDSVDMIREKYPQVHLIANVDNPGFAKANNQAINEIFKKVDYKDSLDKSQHYILLLNPDTVVENNTFDSCINFIDSHPDCGGLGVKMINGDGVFLKESKRGFPSPQASFFKISGLIHLFPHHPKVAAYYMGDRSDDETQEIDILPGAFIMTRRDVLDKTGLLDESYFMYGEDIDFSWRIKLAGFKNYYLPTSRILHYKGECTRKGSINYVYTFYNAMSIFSRHYFNGKGARLYSCCIQMAIWARAALALLQRMLHFLALPLLDFLCSFAGFFIIKQVWSTYWAENINYYPPFYTYAIIPLYILILLASTFISGGYDKPYKAVRVVKGMAWGAFILLVFYSLMDETLRFSRTIVLLGSLWTITATIAIRAILKLLKVDGFSSKSARLRYLIVGSEEEQRRVFDLLGQLGIEPASIVSRTPEEFDFHASSIPQKTDEIVYCSKDIPLSLILDSTIALHKCDVNFRIAPENADVLVGSNYTNSPEDLYANDIEYSIASITNQRSKRIFDFSSSLMLLILSPIIFWFQRRKRRYFPDCINVLFARRSWVGYSQCPSALDQSKPLPHIRKGIFRTQDRLPRVKRPDTQRLDKQYAENYTVITDFIILLRNLNKI